MQCGSESLKVNPGLCSFLFPNTCVFSSCAGDPLMGLCCIAEFILGRREFVDWTMCPVSIGVTHCFLGRCLEELKFLKGLHTVDSNKNYEDVKSGLVPCCNNVKGRCQLGRNYFKNFDEPVVADENRISEAFAHSSCWLCPRGIDVWSTYDSAPELFQLPVWPKMNWNCSHLDFIPACWN